MRTFFSSFGFVAMRFAGLSPQAEGRTQGSQSKGRWTSRERARWQGSFLSCGEFPLVGAVGGWPVGSPGASPSPYAGRVAGSATGADVAARAVATSRRSAARWAVRPADPPRGV